MFDWNHTFAKLIDLCLLRRLWSAWPSSSIDHFQMMTVLAHIRLIIMPTHEKYFLYISFLNHPQTPIQEVFLWKKYLRNFVLTPSHNKPMILFLGALLTWKIYPSQFVSVIIQLSSIKFVPHTKHIFQCTRHRTRKNKWLVLHNFLNVVWTRGTTAATDNCKSFICSFALKYPSSCK